MDPPPLGESLQNERVYSNSPCIWQVRANFITPYLGDLGMKNVQKMKEKRCSCTIQM